MSQKYPKYKQLKHQKTTSVRESNEGKDMLNRKNDPKFSDFFELYLENYAIRQQKDWKGTESRIRRLVFPVIGNIRLSKVTREQLICLHSKLSEDHPVNANRTLDITRAVFNVAKRWGSFKGDNPCEAVIRNRETPRTRFLAPLEIKRLLACIEQEAFEGNVFAARAIHFLLLTGLRRGEALRTRWEDVIVLADKTVLQVTKTKNKTTLYLPLSTAAMNMLDSLPRLSDNPYLFPGHKRGHPLVNVQKPWERLRDRAQLSNVRLHDLRHTVASDMVNNGENLHVIGGVLNHRSQQSTQRYAHLAQQTTCDAMEAYGNRLMGLQNGTSNQPPTDPSPQTSPPNIVGCSVPPIVDSSPYNDHVPHQIPAASFPDTRQRRAARPIPIRRSTSHMPTPKFR